MNRRLTATLIILAAACSPNADARSDEDTAAAPDTTTVAADSALQCADDDGGITLPAGFCAVVVADEVGAARHVAVRGNGDVYVTLAGGQHGASGVLALRDRDGDGVADRRESFGPEGGTGIALVGDSVLYFATNTAVVRYRLAADSLLPVSGPDTIVSGLPARPGHTAKSITVRGRDLFVDVGSPSNSCQVEDRTARSPGRDPCPELETRAGVWRFDASRTGQTQVDGERFATGIRNMVAQTIGPDGQLWGVQHGRDQLGGNWGYTDEQNAELPAEELLSIQKGDDFGWPYCYYDPEQKQLLLAPEYGGGGEQVERCADKEDPVVAFPAHWAPDGIVFYTGRQFPTEYRGGAFIAFHGSWNRAPLPQQGYNVVFVPFSGGAPSGDWRVFAKGFPGTEPLSSSADAAHRPTGVAVGPDGSLYVTDDAGGRVWRIVWRGTR